MIPKKPAPDLIRGGYRFSEKHALGLDPRACPGLDPGDHAPTILERDGDSEKSHLALAARTAIMCAGPSAERQAVGERGQRVGATGCQVAADAWDRGRRPRLGWPSSLAPG